MGKLQRIPGIGGRGLTAAQEALLIGALQKSGGTMTGNLKLPLNGILYLGDYDYIKSSSAGLRYIQIFMNETMTAEFQREQTVFLKNVFVNNKDILLDADHTVDGVDVGSHDHGGGARMGSPIKRIRSGLIASRPASGDNIGDAYFASDDESLSIWRGDGWIVFTAA